MLFLAIITFFSLLGGLATLFGIVFLLMNESWSRRNSIYVITFAAGALLAAVFFDIIPEIAKENASFLPYIIIGIVIFFIIEKVLVWHHCHEEECEASTFGSVAILSHSLHHFIDGIIIAASFLVNYKLGIISTLAVIFHEVPEGIGQFAILLHSGTQTKRAIAYSVIAVLMDPIGAALTYFAVGTFKDISVPLLSVAAGGFIYLAGSEIIPEVHQRLKHRKISLQIGLLLAGIFVIWLVGKI